MFVCVREKERERERERDRERERERKTRREKGGKEITGRPSGENLSWASC